MNSLTEVEGKLIFDFSASVIIAGGENEGRKQVGSGIAAGTTECIRRS
ncbi:hypothetical protein [Pelotalea chapellei]|uniref:Uncharacterized protein n=1 Tax=Pelotalea chapellei TaxID=44671 RepID=A0ABS5U9D4_9BACT|nr:hypothetical protein [Pelotalea chapellei]MBT1072279.1 hypothetical protein [Pelotalea chapellei]